MVSFILSIALSLLITLTLFNNDYFLYFATALSVILINVFYELFTYKKYKKDKE